MEHEDAGTPARPPAAGGDPEEISTDTTPLTHAVDAEGDGAIQAGESLTVHTTAVLLAFGAGPRPADPAGRTPTSLAGSCGHDLAVRLPEAHIGQRSGTSG